MYQELKKSAVILLYLYLRNCAHQTSRTPRAARYRSKGGLHSSLFCTAVGRATHCSLARAVPRDKILAIQVKTSPQALLKNDCHWTQETRTLGDYGVLSWGRGLLLSLAESRDSSCHELLTLRPFLVVSHILQICLHCTEYLLFYYWNTKRRYGGTNSQARHTLESSLCDARSLLLWCGRCVRSPPLLSVP
jgi:hypothetical protein